MKLNEKKRSGATLKKKGRAAWLCLVVVLGSPPRRSPRCVVMGHLPCHGAYASSFGPQPRPYAVHIILGLYASSVCCPWAVRVILRSCMSSSGCTCRPLVVRIV